MSGFVTLAGATVRTVATEAPAVALEVTQLAGTLRRLRLLIEELPGRLDHVERVLDHLDGRIALGDLASTRTDDTASTAEIEDIAAELRELEGRLARVPSTPE